MSAQRTSLEGFYKECSDTQSKMFKAWVSRQLESVGGDALPADAELAHSFPTGERLGMLYQSLTGEDLGFKHYRHAPSPAVARDRTETCLQKFKEDPNLHIDGLAATDFTGGNYKFVTGFIWQLITRFDKSSRGVSMEAWCDQQESGPPPAAILPESMEKDIERVEELINASIRNQGEPLEMSFSVENFNNELQMSFSVENFNNELQEAVSSFRGSLAEIEDDDLDSGGFALHTSNSFNEPGRARCMHLRDHLDKDGIKKMDPETVKYWFGILNNETRDNTGQPLLPDAMLPTFPVEKLREILVMHQVKMEEMQTNLRESIAPVSKELEIDINDTLSWGGIDRMSPEVVEFWMDELNANIQKETGMPLMPEAALAAMSDKQLRDILKMNIKKMQWDAQRLVEEKQAEEKQAEEESKAPKEDVVLTVVVTFGFSGRSRQFYKSQSKHSGGGMLGAYHRAFGSK